jgi:hypothetical protein
MLNANGDSIRRRDFFGGCVVDDPARERVPLAQRSLYCAHQVAPGVGRVVGWQDLSVPLQPYDCCERRPVHRLDRRGLVRAVLDPQSRTAPPHPLRCTVRGPAVRDRG